jgi:hypothetical protein
MGTGRGLTTPFGRRTRWGTWRKPTLLAVSGYRRTCGAEDVGRNCGAIAAGVVRVAAFVQIYGL